MIRFVSKKLKIPFELGNKLLLFSRDVRVGSAQLAKIILLLTAIGLRENLQCIPRSFNLAGEKDVELLIEKDRQASCTFPYHWYPLLARVPSNLLKHASFFYPIQLNMIRSLEKPLSKNTIMNFMEWMCPKELR